MSFTTMRDITERTPSVGVWTSRVAVFGIALLISAVFLHRFFSIPTGIALNLLKLSILCGLAAVALGAMAAAHIWQHGGQGGGRVFAGMLLGVLLIGWPLPQLETLGRLPEINDVSTDTNNPPAFVALAAVRPDDANAAAYPGESFAEAQAEAYPDLRPLLINRSVGEAYDICADALRRQKLTIVREEPPALEAGGAAQGIIEAYDRTLLWGFYDDVVVRVTGTGASAQIDVRSASRYGRHDLGANAERVRRILREIVWRLEATVSGAGADRQRTSGREAPRKEEKARGRGSERGSERR